MILLKLISPKEPPAKKSDWKFRHKVYRALLKMYFLFYSKGVIEDRIVVNGVEVMHSLRDLWFENELRRFEINISTTLKDIPKYSLQKKRYHRYCTFNWEDKLMVVHSGKNFSIARKNRVSIDADMAGQLQTSSERDKILSVLYKSDLKNEAATVKKTTRIAELKKEQGKPQSPKAHQSKKKIHIKDAINPEQGTPLNEKPTEIPLKETYTKHVGFEENDLF